jgi:hypothetical protein
MTPAFSASAFAWLVASVMCALAMWGAYLILSMF